ncbi:MAG: cell division protein ZapA [Pseudomonadota bacterium]
MKQTVEVTIMGQKFLIKGDSDETYVKEIANYVDRKVNEVQSKTKSVASLNVVILAAMNIADEFFKFRKEKDDKFQKVEKKIQNMVELIDLQL